ncbi:MAG: hypothetical protein P8Z79_02740 [Sedimentisphaerales bacterium]
MQNVDNPELGELIQVAMENKSKLHSLDQIETMELIRKVTVSYTQIKLFDKQIAEISRKIEASTGPAEIRYELTLAKTELEAKLMTEVANLRELMGIIPRHAFEKQPTRSLNTWLVLNVIDERIYVLETLKPFRDWWAALRWNSAGLLSAKETLDYTRERLNNKNNLPIRIDIYHASDMRSAAEELRSKIVSLAEEANAQMEAEVHTELSTWVGSGVSTFFIRQGTISTLYPGGKQITRPDGGSKPIVTGVVEPNDLDQHIKWRLTMPKNVPLKFRIEYDETSTALAMQTADKVRAVAKDLGISELVDVERALVDSVPESAFLGRWQAITKGDIQTIDIQPAGVCVFGKSPGSKIRGGTNVPGKWFLTPKEIFMDIKDRRSVGYYVYRGHLDTEGNLAVDRGEVLPQGNFGSDRLYLMVFKKVY